MNCVRVVSAREMMMVPLPTKLTWIVIVHGSNFCNVAVELLSNIVTGVNISNTVSTNKRRHLDDLGNFVDDHRPGTDVTSHFCEIHVASAGAALECAATSHDAFE